MINLAQNPSERPSGTSLVSLTRSGQERFEARIAEVFKARGTSPACILARMADTVGLVVSALETDPDRIATDAMVDELIEATRLLAVVVEELNGRAEPEPEPELELAISYTKASGGAAAMMRGLAQQGVQHDRFVWTTMLTQLEMEVLSTEASKAAFATADQLRSGPIGARLEALDAVDAAAEE